MQPIKLEIFLDDKTRSGMQSAERNITGLETQIAGGDQYPEKGIDRLAVRIQGCVVYGRFFAFRSGGYTSSEG